ncbi:hypothetical protein CROQUDRAFT_87867 [Cronartium quercuum f. sp. fusiforme G11]|uniref:Secreted protein n=1 Tax=Cronartium quercuum f. sp. fusiforme G11 TaxID=708437 RepID=A0A9P6TH31_9BASI|nr:hypothetical protein CROQUDRAFT_87867 [Cronartium quercuum f. sp. fusiforme G11]
MVCHRRFFFLLDSLILTLCKPALLAFRPATRHTRHEAICLRPSSPYSKIPKAINSNMPWNLWHHLHRRESWLASRYFEFDIRSDPLLISGPFAFRRYATSAALTARRKIAGSHCMATVS